jgi:hypothetical protein
MSRYGNSYGAACFLPQRPWRLIFPSISWRNDLSQVIHMREIVQALDEQLMKQGKVRTAVQFGPYYELLRSTQRVAAVLEPGEHRAPGLLVHAVKQ